MTASSTSSRLRSLSRFTSTSSVLPAHLCSLSLQLSARRSLNSASWRRRTLFVVLSSVRATTTPSPLRSSSAMCWRTPAGTRHTRPTSLRFLKAVWKPSSTSRPWSPTSPDSLPPTARCSMRAPLPWKPCCWLVVPPRLTPTSSLSTPTPWLKPRA